MFYQTNIKVKEIITYQLYSVTIGNAKIIEKIEFHPQALVLNITKSHLVVVI